MVGGRSRVPPSNDNDVDGYDALRTHDADPECTVDIMGSAVPVGGMCVYDT